MKKLRKKLGILALLALLGAVAVFARDAIGDGVALFSTSKSLPEATVAVIDPETGSSSGGEGGDVKLAEGDIILFRFSFTPVPDKVNRGLQAYMTDYIPDGTEVVGARFIDTDGHTIVPRLPGIAIDGCSGGSLCTTFDNLPCSAGAGCSAGLVDFAGGSASQLHGDTGIFYTTDGRLAKLPSDSFLSTESGDIAMIEPTNIDPELTPLLSINPGPYYAHNHWDYDQVLAFGISNSNGNFSGNSGQGNVPYRYGSPVAGPQSFYMYEATDIGSLPTDDTIEFNDVIGPWQRIKSPGSMVGIGGCISSGSVTCTPEATGADFVRTIVPAATATHCGATGTEPCVGTDITPANPTDASAVRFALGESRTGVPGAAEIALRVKPGGVPIDSLFGGTGGNVNCMETIGSNIAMRDTGNNGDANQWGSYIGSPACVFLRLLLDLNADTELALGSGVNYTLRLKNLAVTDETGVVLRQRWNGSNGSFVAVTSGPAPDGPPAACPAPDGGLQCLTWTIGTMAPSDEITIETQFTAGGAGGGTLVMEAVYTSNELPAPDFRTRDVTVIKPIALPVITIAPVWDPTLTAIAGDGSGVAAFSGTIANNGTKDFTYDEINFVLPAGFSITGDQITINGSNYTCTPAGSSTPSCNTSLSFAPATSLPLSFSIDVPSATTDLYDFDIQFWGSQPAFGGGFETYLPDIGTINVGAVRTDPPVIDCPVVASQPAVTGTSDPNADIILSFNLLPRGTDVADGAGDWSISSYDDFGPFGDMYGGLELSATAQLTGELISEPSAPCEVTPSRECTDGFDNDGDGLIDFPADPGCESPTDNSETDPTPPQCSDGTDNDSDTFTDFPDDLSCQDAFDDDESGPPACSDGIDNDGDTLIDFPMDMGCTDANDPNEIDFAACENGLDDDGDGAVDFPDDPGCHSASDDDERTSCQNGVDDDGDGLVDLADPGCANVFDDIEADFPSDIKARLLIVFDTSGSMNYHTCGPEFTGGDGSTECPGSDVDCATCGAADCGNTFPDDSRMAKVKNGIGNVIAAFGEVEYGLMRFHQRAEPFTVPDDCPGPNAGLQSGGWQGGGLAPCSGGFNAGDLLVGFAADNQYALLSWMDGETNYPGSEVPRTMDKELRGSGSTPLAGALGSALTVLTDIRDDDEQKDCRPYRVILVTDGAETCGGDPEAAAAALEAAGFEVDVIGFATSDVDIIAALDAIADAGDDGIDNDSATAILASDSVTLSTEIAKIINETLLVERCDGIDNDCDILVDEDFPELGNACDNGELGVCYETGVYVCTADELGVECSAGPGTPLCPPEAPGDPECDCNGLDDDCDGLVDEGHPASCVCVPSDEICNGVDDDCDLLVDGDDPDPLSGECTDCCGIDIGECTFGSIECIGGVLTCTGGNGPTTEICDGLDNDCDTLVDELVEPCYEFVDGCDLVAGTCDGLCRIGLRSCLEPGDLGYPGDGECVGDVGPIGEKCNGLDDDCDGLVDEDFNVGDACDNGQVGVCYVVGTYQCLADGSDTFCTAFPVTPGTEICNGLDDDCDDLIDADDPDLGPPVGNPCGSGTLCTGGTLECIDGELSCEGATGGSPEVCDGIDNDCDGTIDEPEDLVPPGPPPGSYDCTDAGYEDIGDTGECEFGTWACPAGAWICVDYKGPADEICNGIDDNCDGMVDNEAECPSPQDICLEGTCVSPCSMDEFPCPFGFICRTIPDEGDYCVPDPCLDVTCPADELCDSDTGECYDPCDTISCPPGTTCHLGGCFDCFDPGYGCEEGQLCILDSGTGIGTCEDDPCFDVTCEDDEFCRDGDCVPITCDPACELGERCDEGVCVDDPCAGKSCGEGRVCDPDSGNCVNDPCFQVECPAGQACNPATSGCESDPCTGITCPDGTECALTLEGRPTCVEPPAPPSEEIFAAGAGCDCAVGDPPAPGAGTWLLMLGVGLALWPRRRRRR